jgi:hypothetical protein
MTKVRRIGFIILLSAIFVACGDRGASLSRADQQPPIRNDSESMPKISKYKETVVRLTQELGLIPKKEFDQNLKISPQVFDETTEGTGFCLITSTDILGVFERAIDENNHVQYALRNPKYNHISLMTERLHEIAALGAFLKAHNQTPYNSFLVLTYRDLWLRNCRTFNLSVCEDVPTDVLNEEHVRIAALELVFKRKISDLEDAEVDVEHPSWTAP